MSLMRAPPSRRSWRRLRPARHRSAARSFGTIPPVSSPASSMRSTSTPRTVAATAPPSSRPGTSVRKRIRSAPSPIASAAAASSALTFNGPSASGATTGISPASSAAATAAGRDGSASPTRPSSGTGVACRPISSPKSGTAREPSAAQISELTAANDSRTTASPASVVTRRPPTKVTSSPSRSISAEICGPAPWTTQTECSRAIRVTRLVASAATAPPSLTTIELTSGSPR